MTQAQRPAPSFDPSTSILRHLVAAGTDPAQYLGHHIALHGGSGIGGALQAANIPQDYRHLTPQDAPMLATQADAARAAKRLSERFREHFKDGYRLRSAYLHSTSPGTGKTTLACALLNEFIALNYLAKLKGLAHHRHPAYFLDVNAWQGSYNLAVALGKDSAEMQAFVAELRLAQAAQLIVLDDIGVREATPGFRTHLHTLVNARVAAGKPTIYTSNIEMKELAMVFGEQRLADRVKEQCVEIAFTGGSKRGLR